MQPAPMTPDTLKLIRANAERMPAQQLAEQLGWPLDRLRRCARDRQIVLINPQPSLTTFPATAPAPTLADIRAPFKRRRGPAPGSQVGPEIIIRSDMTLDEIADVVPRRQRQMLRVLMSAQSAGIAEFITSTEIASRAGDGLDYGTVASTARGLNIRLRPTRWTIESTNGRAGGYRIGARI